MEIDLSSIAESTDSGFKPDLIVKLMLSSVAMPRYIVAIDQSLGALGLVVLDLKAGSDNYEARALGIDVVACDVLKTEQPNRRGHASNIYRTRDLWNQLQAWFREPGRDQYLLSTILVIEHPPVARPGVGRPESSLLAAAAVAIAFPDLDPVLVEAQRARQLICRIPGQGKFELSRVLHRDWPELIAQLSRNNEATRDAVALGLAYLWDHYEGRL